MATPPVADAVPQDVDENGEYFTLYFIFSLLEFTVICRHYTVLIFSLLKFTVIRKHYLNNTEFY